MAQGDHNDDDALKTGTRPAPPDGPASGPSSSSSSSSSRPKSGSGAKSEHRPVSRTRTGSHPNDARFAPGEVIADRFRIVGLLGRGGMGEVYRADDLRLAQPVALKFLPESFSADPDRLDRFYNEVRVARQVAHPNVCRMYDIGDVDGLHYLAMEFVDGDDLASLLRRIGRLPEDKGLDLTRQLCAGLSAAHERGVLHRDLKPENIMIDGRGKVRITDFGLAGIAEEIAPGDIRSGTPAYMSPEQLSGREVTARSDIYSLGLVLYEIFTGKKAFEGKTFVEFLRKHEQETPTEPVRIVPTLDPAIESAIMRCLAKDPKARPSSALAVAGSLPGADPLTAALLAGETPSPEMVAAAGGGVVLPAPVLWLSAAVSAVVTLAMVFLQLVDTIPQRIPMEKPLAVLEDRAREILKTMGASLDGGDHAGGLSADYEYLLDVAKRDSSVTRWDHLALNNPAILQYWYRHSPRPLYSLDSSGRVFSSNPPALVSAMTGVWLDSAGRLIQYYEVPPQRDALDAGTAAKAVEYLPLFQMARIDPATLTEVTPEWMPAFGFDARKAWTGSFTNAPQIPYRIEAASYRGRPVWFQVIGGWERAQRMQPFTLSSQQRLGQLLGVVIILALGCSGIWFARRNLLAGRGDRRGALTLTVASIVVGIAAWALQAHHLVDLGQELSLFENGLGQILIQAFFFATIYLALEPEIRRLHPEMLISWTRLLSGRFADPLVAGHALIGSAAGIFFAFGLTMMARLWEPAPPIPNVSYFDAMTGVSDSVVPLLNRLQQSVGIGLATLLLTIGIERIVKRLWLAGFLTVVIITFREALVSQAPWWIVFATCSLLFAVPMYTMIRYGVLTFMFAMLLVNLLLSLPLTSHAGEWYAIPTRMVLLLVGLIIAWGLRYGRAPSSA